MDLDDEELEATRKLNGADKTSNIEEDIKMMYHIIEFYKRLDTMHGNDKCKEIKAIENILAKQEADKKRIKELEEKLLDMIKGTETIKTETAKETAEYIKEEYIPVQKVKEILDRLHITDIEPWSFYKVSGDILFDLKELLEDK